MTYSEIIEAYLSLPGDMKRAFEEYLDFLKKKADNRKHTQKRTAGLAKGLISMKPNFDDPIEDFKEYM